MKTFVLSMLIIAFSITLTSETVSKTAPEISMENTKGEVTSLSSLRGNIVLIDFWASWCKPCRMKHPELVSVYNEFHNQSFANAENFEIFSVSLDRNKASWLSAIEKDGLVWDHHVSDLKAWDCEAAKTYGIRSIPSNVLLDENGVIIGSNLHGTALKAALEELK